MKFKKLRSPVYVNFTLTENCNQNCKFCFNTKKIEKYTPFEKIRDLLDKFKEAEVFEINLFGGEPFIHPEIDKIIRYCDKKDFVTTFVSNGTLIKEDMLSVIADHVDGASISIHGFEKIHDNMAGLPGSYKLAIKSVERLSKKIPTSVCYTLTKYNLENLSYFGDYLMKNYNIVFFGVNRYLPVGKGLAMRKFLEPSIREFNTSIKEIKKLKEKYSIETYITDGFPYCLLEDKDLQEYISSCSAGVDFCNIDSQGNVKLCPATDYIIGNLYDTNLEDLWQNNKLLNNYRNLNWVSRECRECKDAYKCLFGCKISANNIYDIDILKKENGTGRK